MKRKQYSARETTGSQFIFDESGATAVEYAIVASLVAGVIAGAVALLGITVRGLFVINGW